VILDRIGGKDKKDGVSDNRGGGGEWVTSRDMACLQHKVKK